MDDPLPAQWENAFKAGVFRLFEGEPVQYILGVWLFYGFEFKVDKRALIPRPETELLVEKALEALVPGKACRVADVGCGTGCIGLSLGKLRPQARVTLLDISLEALALSQENGLRLGVSARFERWDMRQGPLPGTPYDMIVSNPPYISRVEVDELALRVRGYEPRLALEGGDDGLSFYRALAARGADSLAPGGMMLCELGIGQAQDVSGLMDALFGEMQVWPDMEGIPRIWAGKKK